MESGISVLGVQEPVSAGVEILADVAPSFTYASHQNAIPVLRSLVISNTGGENYSRCRLELVATPPFLQPKTWTVDRLQPGDRLTLFDRLVHMDLGYLSGLDEAERGELAFVLRDGERVIGEARFPVRLLARDEWGGVADMAQLLPAFVMPNDPAVDRLLRAASEMLEKHGLPRGMDGYQSNDPRRARMLATALYFALASWNLHYAEPPASFEARGQKVRRPSVVASSGLATCLDSALLFAAAFEKAGLNSVLLLFEGHAGVGVWLRNRTLPEAVSADAMEVRKAIAAGELLVLETTGATRRPGLSVAQAEDALRARLDPSREHELHAAIDVRRLRDGGIKPLASHVAPEPVPVPVGIGRPPLPPAPPPVPVMPKPAPEPVGIGLPPQAPVPPPAAMVPEPGTVPVGVDRPAQAPEPAPEPIVTEPAPVPVEIDLSPLEPAPPPPEPMVSEPGPAPVGLGLPSQAAEPAPEPVVPEPALEPAGIGLPPTEPEPAPEPLASEPAPLPVGFDLPPLEPAPPSEPAPLPVEFDLPPLEPEPAAAAAPAPDGGEKPATPAGRIARWQSKLLDLSLRNRLLNFKDSRKTVPFLCPDVAYLEDRLSHGAGIRIISLPEHNPIGERDAALYRDMQGEDIHRRFATEALARDELAAPLPGAQLEARLVDLYREARNDLAEGGTNTLFLAVGFLRWKRTGDDTDHLAPLLLVPVKLERKTARSAFTLRFHEDEPRFNATLLQFLKSEFELSLPQFDGPLPEDGAGIDVEGLLKSVRAAVRDVTGMEVVADTALSTFSFAKYLMWKDLVDRTERLRENRLVRHLIDAPDTPFPGPARPAPEAGDLDRKYVPSDVVSLLPADSSQVVASLMAAEGHDMVIVGPPGTGKSQTITNMVAHCLAVGKSVLFVAEKSAALNVVYRRLREHGLATHCLELHSNKTDRKHFLAQLKASWELGGAADVGQWVATNGRLQRRRDELNAYEAAVHRVHANGLSAYDALGLVLRDADKAAPAMTWPGPDAHDADTRAKLEDTADELGRTFAAVGRKPALRFVNVEQWSGAWQQDFLASAAALKGAVEHLAAGFDGFLAALGLPERRGADLAEIARFEAFSAAVEACADEDHSIAFDRDFEKLGSMIAAFETQLSMARETEAQLGGHFAREEIARVPLSKLQQEWWAASVAHWPLRVSRQARVRRLLAVHAIKGKPDPQVALPALRRMQQLLAEIAESPLAGKPLGFAGLDSDLDRIKALVGRATDLRTAFFALPLPRDEAEVATDAVAALVSGGEDPYAVRQAGAAFRATRAAFAEALGAFTAAAGSSPEAFVDAGSPTAVAAALDEVMAARTALAEWSTWCAIRAKAVAQGLGPLVAALEAGEVAPDAARDAFRLAYARWWLPLAIDSMPELRDFRLFQHEHAIDDFRKLDDTVRALAPARVTHRIAHGLPTAQNVAPNSELGLLRHQMELQRPSKSIREMIFRMPETFGKLAPCMLMSPLSIAQYLPAGHALFDVVIFDEASQITTWDAVGAIARGRQTVIVGDPKQLPPTNFFGRNEDEQDEELEHYEKDLQSILDEAKASGVPVRLLNWHYRSRDEALIAFSNANYYENRLITFPAPKVGSRAVRLQEVSDGIYLGGAGARRTNPVEARAVAEEAAARMRASLALPEKERPSLGIITFNAQQQALIEDLLDKARRDTPEIEWFFAEERFEPTIVKNLENVQGEERDAILFSITYTQDGAGRRRMNFGALNRDGGERRLNVAITRARQELLVFSGTRAEHIDLDRTKAVGARHLKAFLDYAERGAVALAAVDAGSVGALESPFEEAVAAELARRGWQVVPQVGVSGFRIDLGIKHPEAEGRYLAGVECDGATYHRSATARDRDKVREEVLRGLGWKIVRIWSTDWWRDRDAAARRLDEALRALLAEPSAPAEAREGSRRWELSQAVGPSAVEPAVGEGASDAADAEAATADEAASAGTAADGVADASADQDARVGTAPGEAPAAGATAPGLSPKPVPSGAGPAGGSAMPGAVGRGPAYRVTDLSLFEARPDQFYEDSYGARLSAMVQAVLACEAPVREDILAQRIARAHGWLRTGGRIKAQVARHLSGVARTSESSGDFLWQEGTLTERLAYRAPADENARRSVAEIPLAELVFVVDQNRDLLQADDPTLMLARRLGIDRLVGVTRARLDEAIARARG